MGTDGDLNQMWKDRKKNLSQREGYAALIKQETSGGLFGISKTGAKISRITGTSDYGLYYDAKGRLTAGIGHLVKEDESPEQFMNLTQAEAYKLKDADLKSHDAEAMKLMEKNGVNISNLHKYQLDAVKDFVYQLGAPNASKFKKSWAKLRKASNSKNPMDMEAAVAEFGNSKWGRNFRDTRFSDFKERMLYVPQGVDQGQEYGPSTAELTQNGTFKIPDGANYNSKLPEFQKQQAYRKVTEAEKDQADFRTKLAFYAQMDPQGDKLSEHRKAIDGYFKHMGYDPDQRVADASGERPAQLDAQRIQTKTDSSADQGEQEALKSVPRADLGARQMSISKPVIEQISNISFEGMGNDLVNKFTDRNAIGMLTEAAINNMLQKDIVDPHFNIQKQDSKLYEDMTQGLEPDDVVKVLDNSFNRADFIKNASLAQGKRKRMQDMQSYTENHPVLSGVNSVGNVIVEGAAFMPVGTMISGATKATKIKALTDLTKTGIRSYALGETLEQGLQEVIWSKYDKDYEFDPVMFASSIGLGVGLKMATGSPEANKMVRDFLKNEDGFINIATKEGKKLVDEVASKVDNEQAIALAHKIVKKKIKVGNLIRKDLDAKRSSLVRRMEILDRRIKGEDVASEVKRLKGLKQKVSRKLSSFDKRLPKQLQQLADGTHPKLLAEVNPEFKITTIAKELGIPANQVNTIEKARKFLGLDGVDVNPDFVLEGEKGYKQVMRSQLKEMANNKRLNMNESLRYAAGTGFVKSLDELPVLGKLQVGDKLRALAETDGPVSKLLFNKGNLVSSDNPYVASFYNFLAPDGMGRQGMSRIRAIESQQKYANIFGGDLMNIYHTHGSKIYDILNESRFGTKLKGILSPDSYEEAVEPLLKARLLDPSGVNFRAKYGDEIANAADDFYHDFNTLNRKIVNRAKELGVEGVNFEATDGWFHRSWDFRKARSADLADLKDTIFRGMKSHAEALGIKNINEAELKQHAKKFAYGIRNADITSIEGLQSDHIKLLEKLIRKGEGTDTKLIENEVARLKMLKSKADMGELANRVQMDVTQKLKDGRSLSDLFEDNFIHTQKRYTSKMAGRIAAAEHGIKNIDELDNWVNDAVKHEAERLAKKGVKNPRQAAKFVEDSMRQDLASFKHGGMVGLHDLPDDAANDFVRLVKKYNFARLMQYTGISSIAELGGTFVEAGVSNTLGEMGRYFRNHFNDLYLDNPDMYTGRLYDELRSITGVGMEDFSFTSKGMAKATRVFESGALNTMEKGVDVLGRAAQLPFGGIEKVGRRVTTNALAIKWANHFKGTETGGILSAFFGSNGVTNRVLENSGFGMVDSAGKFIPNNTYKSIKKAINSFADFDKQGRLIKLNLEKWDNNVAHSFGDAIQMQASHIMVNPDATTMALWQSSTVGQILNQFRTFTVNATTKVMGQAVGNALVSSNRGDHAELVKAAQKIFWGTSLGMLSVALRQGIQRAGGDKEVDLFDEGLIKAAAIGFSRSSVAGNLPTISDSISGTFGYDPIFDKTSSVGRSKNFFNLSTTPTGQAIGGAWKGVEKGAQGDFKGASMQLLKSSPVYRQIGAQQIFNFIDKEK